MKYPIKVILFSVSILLLTNYLFAQAPDTLWTRIYGGPDDDEGYAVQQTLDGNFILAGYTFSFGINGADGWLIKSNIYGDIIWTKTYDFGGGEAIYDVQLTDDGGYILAGVATGPNVLLIKTNSEGDTSWTGQYPYGIARSVQQTSDGGYIIAGDATNVDAGIVKKMDSLGILQWEIYYPGFGNPRMFRSVIETDDGGYALVGEITAIGNNTNLWLVKIDSNGDSLWTRQFGGSEYDVGWSIKKTNDGNFIIVGRATSFGGGVFLIKANHAGDTLWTKVIDSGNAFWGYSVDQTNDDGYVITGYSESTSSGKDVLILRTDSQGKLLWTKTLGGSEQDLGLSVQQTTDGEYIIVGSTKSFGLGKWDVWFVKLGPDSLSGIINYEKSISSSFSFKQNYPNPFNPTTTIKYQIPELSFVTIKVYDVLGKEVATIVNDEIPSGSYEIEFNASNLPSGIYFYRLQAGSFVETKKMVLMK